MKAWFTAHADLIVFIVLIGSGGLLLAKPGISNDAASVAALAGALFGAAATLLGNWINRRNERSKAIQSEINAKALESEHTAKLKALIAPELVNLAAGMLSTKSLIDAAVANGVRGGTWSGDFSYCTPRATPLLESLGIELLALDRPSFDALMTLRANLTETRESAKKLSEGQSIGRIVTERMMRCIAHDLEILVECFEKIAPDRRLLVDGIENSATHILRRAAGTDPVAQTPIEMFMEEITVRQPSR